MFITPYVVRSQKDIEQITEAKKKEMEPALETIEQEDTEQ